MATKTREEIEIKVENPEADCHHMIRMLSFSGMYTESGHIPVDQADADVRNWLQAGYRLAHVAVLGLEPGGVNVLYVLVKDQ